MKRARWLMVLAFASVAGVGVWLALAPGNERDPNRDALLAGRDEPSEEALPRPAPHPVAPARPVATRKQAELAVAEPPAEVTANPRQIVGPRPNDPHEPGMLPHPLDEARERIFKENRLLQSLNDAMSFRRVNEMREMLVEYRELDPNDIDKYQLGYEVIADCIEFPGNASLTAAHEFYDTQRHSPLRRFVRRICFENKN